MTDADGRSSIAWRHIYPEQHARHRVPHDRRTAAPPTDAVRISEDQWQLAGCPDDGPGDGEGRRRPHSRRLADARQGRHAVERHLLRFDRRPPCVLGARAARRRHEPGGIAPTTRARRRERPRRRCGTSPTKDRAGSCCGIARTAARNGRRSRRCPMRRPRTIRPPPSSADALLAVWTSATTPRSTIVVYRRPISNGAVTQ